MEPACGGVSFLAFWGRLLSELLHGLPGGLLGPLATELINKPSMMMLAMASSLVASLAAHVIGTMSPNPTVVITTAPKYNIRNAPLVGVTGLN